MDQNELLQVAKENRTMLDVLVLKQELSGEISKLTERVETLEYRLHSLCIKVADLAEAIHQHDQGGQCCSSEGGQEQGKGHRQIGLHFRTPCSCPSAR